MVATGALHCDAARAGRLKETLLHEAEVGETDDAVAVEVIAEVDTAIRSRQREVGAEGCDRCERRDAPPLLPTATSTRWGMPLTSVSH